MSEWISVDDELPKDYIPVLTYDENYPICIQPLMIFSDNEGWLWAGLDFTGDIADPENYVCDDDYTCTHWMSLPKPPKETPCE